MNTKYPQGEEKKIIHPPSKVYLQWVERKRGQELLPLLFLFYHQGNGASCRAWVENTTGKAKHPEQQEPCTEPQKLTAAQGVVSQGFPFPGSKEIPTKIDKDTE